MTGTVQGIATVIDAGDRIGPLPALLLVPPAVRALYVLAHGAGAGMKHPFLEAVAGELAERRIGTLRYEFPYMAEGRGRPDPPAVIQAVVRRAVDTARTLAPGIPLLAGGKSFGGRMTSQAAAAGGLPEVMGLVFLGFPLHPPKQPGTRRAEHLDGVSLPMLFLQGTRDDLAHLDLLRPLCERLGERVRLHVVEGADHSFHVLKRSGRTDGEVLVEISAVTEEWMAGVTGRG